VINTSDVSESISYPDIKSVASRYSKRYQLLNNGIVLISLLVLVLASIISFWPNLALGLPFSQSLLLIAGLFLSMFSSLKKPDRTWFAARSLTETIKTLSWRYIMQAVPLDGCDAENLYWKKIKKACEESNNLIREEVFSVGNYDIKSLISLRSLGFDEKVELYSRGRIHSQLSWYLNKAKENKARSVLIFCFLMLVNLLAVILSISEEAGFSDVKLPVDVLITIAGAVIAWGQCKKFNELSAAYEFTASEIIPLVNEIEKIKTNSELSEFVRIAEELFSREHTQWAAKRS